jgi:hypothetical protein
MADGGTRFFRRLEPRSGACIARSEFVADLPEQFLSPFDVRLAFNTLGSKSVHDAHDAAPLTGFGNKHLGRVGRGAEDPADLGYQFDGIEHVDGIKTIRKENDKAV